MQVKGRWQGKHAYRWNKIKPDVLSHGNACMLHDFYKFR
jgi:hypothetical protein